MKKKSLFVAAVVVLCVVFFGNVKSFAKNKVSEEPARQENIDIYEEEKHFVEYLLNTGLAQGIIGHKFDSGKRLSYGEFALMAYNTVCPEQLKNNKKGRAVAINWLKDYYGISWKSSKKMTYDMAELVISCIMGKGDDTEFFTNLRHEAKQFFPSLSLGGQKMGSIEGLYVICMTIGPEMPMYYPLTVQMDGQNG